MSQTSWKWGEDGGFKEVVQDQTVKNEAEFLSISTRPTGENVALINSFMFFTAISRKKDPLSDQKTECK